ncbi:hypothetical protein [Pseudomonas phage PseuP_222]|nr:hypothetical protein [Pseudomonas phage PseuP_222]
MSEIPTFLQAAIRDTPASRRAARRSMSFKSRSLSTTLLLNVNPPSWEARRMADSDFPVAAMAWSMVMVLASSRIVST